MTDVADQVEHPVDNNLIQVFLCHATHVAAKKLWRLLVLAKSCSELLAGLICRYYPALGPNAIVGVGGAIEQCPLSASRNGQGGQVTQVEYGKYRLPRRSKAG
jgi:hypothetical protein